MSFEIAYKMGQLRAKLDGDNAALMDEIVELARKEESATKDVVSIPFISTPQKTKMDDWTPWVGKRASQGRTIPVGFPRSGKFGK